MVSPLTEVGIRNALKDEYKDLPITVYSVVGSTNLVAMDYAKAQVSPLTTPVVFIADEQTAGRGRIGRTFLSPGGRGIYMSILIPKSAWERDGEGAVSPTLITTYSAVMVSRAIATLTPLTPKIKWVNDIYIGEYKLAGILTQGVLSPSGDCIDYAVMGVGINVHGTSLPDEIDSIATTLEREIMKTERCEAVELSREVIVAKILELFLDNLPMLGTPHIANEYRKRSYLIGRDITVKRVGREYPAHILGITDNCELILRLMDGSEEILATGEVSVREIKQK